MESKTNFPKGFSLIELLVAIFILILSVGLTLASFRNMKPLDEVEAAARGIASTIREAQNNSVTGREQVISGVLQPVCDNGVQFSNSAGNLLVESNYLTKDAGVCTGDPSFIVPEKVKTYKNVSVDAASSLERIYFEIPSGAVRFSSGNPADDYFRITITSSTNGSITSAVCVYRSGGVKEILDGAGSC